MAGGPRRILFLASTLAVGGAEVAFTELAERLDRSRFSCLVVCLRRPGPLGERLASRGLRVVSPLFRFREDALGLVRLVALMRREKIELLYTLDHDDAMLWGKIAARAARVRAVVTAVHTFRRWAGKASLGRWGGLTMSLTDRWVAVANAQRDYLLQEEGLPAGRVVVIENGVDLTRFRPVADPGELVRLRAKLGVPGESLVAVTVASIRPEKGHEVLLEGARLVTSALPRSLFFVVGDGEGRPALEDRARALGLEEKVRFLGFRADVPDILAAADVAVLASHTEALPVSLLEAMACGLPVVATSVGAVPSLVDDGETGLLVPVRDANALSQAILTLFRDRELRGKMGRTARVRTESSHSIEQNVARHQELFTELVTRSG